MLRYILLIESVMIATRPQGHAKKLKKSLEHRSGRANKQPSVGHFQGIQSLTALASYTQPYHLRGELLNSRVKTADVF